MVKYVCEEHLFGVSGEKGTERKQCQCLGLGQNHPKRDQ